jgi:hypothetical protein
LVKIDEDRTIMSDGLIWVLQGCDDREDGVADSDRVPPCSPSLATIDDVDSICNIRNSCNVSAVPYKPCDDVDDRDTLADLAHVARAIGVKKSSPVSPRRASLRATVASKPDDALAAMRVLQEMQHGAPSAEGVREAVTAAVVRGYALCASVLLNACPPADPRDPEARDHARQLIGVAIANRRVDVMNALLDAGLLPASENLSLACRVAFCDGVNVLLARSPLMPSKDDVRAACACSTNRNAREVVMTVMTLLRRGGWRMTLRDGEWEFDPDTTSRQSGEV